MSEEYDYKIITCPAGVCMECTSVAYGGLMPSTEINPHARLREIFAGMVPDACEVVYNDIGDGYYKLTSPHDMWYLIGCNSAGETHLVQARRVVPGRKAFLHEVHAEDTPQLANGDMTEKAFQIFGVDAIRYIRFGAIVLDNEDLLRFSAYRAWVVDRDWIDILTKTPLYKIEKRVQIADIERAK